MLANTLYFFGMIGKYFKQYGLNANANAAGWSFKELILLESVSQLNVDLIMYYIIKLQNHKHL